MRVALSLALVALLLQAVAADVYMHNPRGSNNRLDSQGTNRANANRLFDSQNNDKGGYNTGYMQYYSGSILPIEWTNQHGLGANPKTHSQIILQYTCDDIIPDLRDGAVENTIQPPGDLRKYGMHEPFAWYAACFVRERNMGLFTADQNMNNRDNAINTRQNNNGQRYGFECPEERDYYPYWHPTPWIDIAVLTDETSRCSYYRRNSNNRRAYGYCTLTKQQEKTLRQLNNETAEFEGWLDSQQYNNERDCQAATYMWVEERHGEPAPDCELAPLSRDNHLGNVVQRMADGRRRGGWPAYYNWTIPDVSKPTKCVLRMRYNISNADVPWEFDVNNNTQLENNPDVAFFNGQGKEINLTLAINTAQYGRTFEDRSHVFEIIPRVYGRGRVYNLNVRGKRGNIVQVYPAVEYDFVPNRLLMRNSDRIHLQWSGSNSNPAGNDGEGVNSSDRSNVVQMDDGKKNYPAYIANYSIYNDFRPFFRNSEGRNAMYELRRMALNMAETAERLPDSNIQSQLNDAKPHYEYGLLKLRKGRYYYMSTRNNNFSNRSQKGEVQVSGSNDDDLTWVIIVGCIVFAGIVLVCAVVTLLIFAAMRPDSWYGKPIVAVREFFASFVNH